VHVVILSRFDAVVLLTHSSPVAARVVVCVVVRQSLVPLIVLSDAVYACCHLYYCRYVCALHALACSVSSVCRCAQHAGAACSACRRSLCILSLAVSLMHLCHVRCCLKWELCVSLCATIWCRRSCMFDVICEYCQFECV
jgi:hypothetical protein